MNSRQPSANRIKPSALSVLLCVWTLTQILPLCAQTSPADLTRNAYSLIQQATTEMICDSPTSALRKESRTITILNEKGRDAAHFICYCDKFTSLHRFAGEILDAEGKPLRRIKKSELQMTEYSSHLTTDDYRYYFECNMPSYPFTVKYEWEVKYKNGLIGYPRFIPQTDYNQAVARATYRLQTPADQPYRYRAVNTSAPVKQETTADGKLLTEVTFGPLPALEYEPYAPSVSELFPHIFFAPSRFSYDGSQGSMTTWKEYGDWQYGLLAGRDLLTDPAKAKVRELTASCTTPREKVKAIYDHLAATTRYVSIQLGIGGLQPLPAADVCRTGFGDCKGLSNYARALLAEVGIDSRYTVINTNKARLFRDFASADQMNHVILQVPLPGDTLWLECTNAQLPFGYVHSDIADHDALLIGADGGTLCRLPSYPDSLNTQSLSAYVTLSPSGEADVRAQETSSLFQYESRAGIVYLDPLKQKERLRNGINLNQVAIGTVQINEQKKAHPQIDINYTLKSDTYGTKTGNRLFIPANIFRKGFRVPDSKQRMHHIHIDYGYLDIDSICLQLPEGFVVESLPRPIQVSNRFGSFSSSIRHEGREIHLVHRLLMYKGTFPKETAEELTTFRKQIAGQYSGKIILKKE